MRLLKTIEASEIVKNRSKREQETTRKKEELYELEKHLKHVETRLELLQELKYEGHERMVTGDEEDKAVMLAKCCELLNERLSRFDGKLNKLLS